MRLVFAGTPEFSVAALDALHRAGHQIVGVFTQPDRPAGRGRKLSPSPVAERAVALSLPVHKPERLREEAQQEDRLSDERIRTVQPASLPSPAPPAAEQKEIRAAASVSQVQVPEVLTPAPSDPEPALEADQGGKTMLYVGIALGAALLIILVVFLLTRR